MKGRNLATSNQSTTFFSNPNDCLEDFGSVSLRVEMIVLVDQLRSICLEISEGLVWIRDDNVSPLEENSLKGQEIE